MAVPSYAPVALKASKLKYESIMTTIVRIDPPIPLNTPKGSAYAHFLIDNGLEDNLQWVCFQDDTGECWTWDNSNIRATKNITIGRTNITEII